MNHMPLPKSSKSFAHHKLACSSPKVESSTLRASAPADSIGGCDELDEAQDQGAYAWQLCLLDLILHYWAAPLYAHVLS